MVIKKLKHKKICVFTNYRTGSSMFSLNLSSSNYLPAIGEYFGSCLNQEGFTYETAMRNFKSMSKCVVKFMPDHLHYNKTMIDLMLAETDKIIYLYRRNFKSQALSWLAAVSNNSFGVTGFSEFEQIPDAEIRVKNLSDKKISRATTILKQNYLMMASYIKSHPGEIICLEDMKTQRPYKRNIIWEQDIPEIEPFDVENILFSGNIQ
jgi:hypothetical protein